MTIYAGSSRCREFPSIRRKTKKPRRPASEIREVQCHASSPLTFTGGIGENAGEIRRLVCERLTWLGVAIDSAANDRSDLRIDSDRSLVDVRVIPTNEELMI